MVFASALRFSPVVFSTVLACAQGGQAATVTGEEAAHDSNVEVPLVPVQEAPIRSIDDLQHAFEQAAAAIEPSVVSIVSKKQIRGRTPFFFPFGPAPEGTQQGMGSGVIVSKTGYVLTNNHVIEGADELTVKLANDQEVSAEVVGTDPQTDLAVIKIEGDSLRPAALGRSADVRVGQWVLAAGSPFGLEQTVSAGIISAVGRRDVAITDYPDFLQTDAAINPGNSGGPLIDLYGRVIGINTAIASRSGGSQGIGFAIPIDMARNVMSQLIETGRVSRGFLGVQLQRLTPDLAQSFGYEGRDGVLIGAVQPDTPAAKAGLQEGDIVIGMDGKPIGALQDFRLAVAAKPPGARVHLEVWRNSKKQTVTVELGEFPGASQGEKSLSDLGLQLLDLTPEVRRQLELSAKHGAVVANVAPGSPAAQAGLQTGDVITSVGSTAVKDAKEAQSALQGADLAKGVRLRVRRGDAGLFIILQTKAEK